MKLKYLILIIIIATGLVYLLGYSTGQQKGDNRVELLDSLHRGIITKYEIVIDSLNLKVAETKQENTTQREALRNSEIEKEELRKLNIKRVAEITRLKMKIDTLINIPPSDSVVYIDTCSDTPRPAMLLPFSFSKKDEWLSLTGQYDIKGSLDLGLKMNVPLDVWTGIDKDTKEYKVVVTTPNPYLDVIQIRSQKFDMPKVKKWGIGFSMGYGMSVKRAEFSPFIGISLNRNLIRF